MGGNHSTNIANGYNKEIQAKVTINKALYKRALREAGSDVSMSEASAKIAGHGKTEFEYEHMQQLPGFVKIAPGEYLVFKMSGKDGKVFVSITSGEEKIADNYPVENNRSIIVDAKGYVQNTKKGEIWIDSLGRNHAVDERSSSEQAIVISSYEDYRVKTAQPGKRMPSLAE